MTGGDSAVARTVEHANAKVNLVLRVGAPREDGMHPLCSLFAALELADEVVVTAGREMARGGRAAGDRDVADEVVCPGVDGDNLAAAAAAAFRVAAPAVYLPPLRIEIQKRIPVAAGLAGGSADAAAVLRAANALSGTPLSPDQLREIAAGLGSDVPSQVEPAHAIVSGIGERVERVDLPPMTLVLVPQDEGLSTGAVYGELDRLRDDVAGAPSLAVGPADAGPSDRLASEPLRRLAAGSLEQLAAGIANDLEPAALALRPRLAEPIAALRDTGALAAQVTGSGPTTFGLFADRLAAERTAATIDGQRAAAAQAAGVAPPPLAIVTELLA
jgi:4-diphosphocytidyl-2-C-methyl-D-erythritol kinase